MEPPKRLWANQTVQFAARYTATAGALLAGFVGIGMLRRRMFKSHAVSVATALAVDVPALAEDVDILDEDLIDLLNRFYVFYGFAPRDFIAVGKAMAVAMRTKTMAYSRTKMIVADALAIRTSFQSVIENVRIMRAILEIKCPTVLEDFDEVAVDLNTKIEDECSSAMLDQMGSRG